MCITNQDQHQMIFNLNTLLQATIWYIPRRDLSCCMQQVIPESREKNIQTQDLVNTSQTLLPQGTIRENSSIA